MANTKIEWTNKVWNPVTGCTKISEGCKHCYAERMAKRLRGRFGYPAEDPFKVTLQEQHLYNPVTWKKPTMVFVGSMTDIFHQNVTDHYLLKIFDIMINLSRHTFQVLTKRPERMVHFFQKHFNFGLPDNIWIGTSAENQQTADERIPILLQIHAAIRFISCEPLLGPIEFSNVTNRSDALSQLGKKALNGIHWVIAGGESGHNARPMHPDWASSLRDQCQQAGVPFFFKQWGEWKPLHRHELKQYPLSKLITHKFEREIDSDGAFVKVGKKKAGRLLDGKEYNAMPAGRQEYPQF